MNETNTKSQIAAAQMSQALARWERDGGALAKSTLTRSSDATAPPGSESALADVAFRQGMLLEGCHEDGATNYRLVPQGESPSRCEDPASFKLTLNDVETILMNRSPA